MCLIFNVLYKILDICTKKWYTLYMNITNECKLDKEQIISKVCKFLKLDSGEISSENVEETIKELCVKKLCKTVGLTGAYNYKSDFFEFFSSIVGEAVCVKLNIKIHIAGDDLRLVKYEKLNLIDEVYSFLEKEDIEEAILDAFNFVDRFKSLISK